MRSKPGGHKEGPPTRKSSSSAYSYHCIYCSMHFHTWDILYIIYIYQYERKMFPLHTHTCDISYIIILYISMREECFPAYSYLGYIIYISIRCRIKKHNFIKYYLTFSQKYLGTLLILTCFDNQSTMPKCFSRFTITVLQVKINYY